MFDWVKNDEHWKGPTKPVLCTSRKKAELYADAIAHFHGGAEIERAPSSYLNWDDDEAENRDRFIVRSEGYYYMSA